MRLRKFFLLSLFVLEAGCVSNADRRPQSTEPTVPKAEELFLRGQFMLKAGTSCAGHQLLPALPCEEHYGEELDLSTRRPAVNLRGTIFQERYGRPGTTLYANFFHHGQFFIARVPDVAVENVEFEFIYFPPLVLGHYVAAHSVLRIDTAVGHEVELVAPVPDQTRLAELSRLSPQDAIAALPTEMTGDGAKIRFLAISAEAQWSEADPLKKYDLKRGDLGAFIQIVRFESMEERFKEFYNNGSPINQVHYPLKNPGDGDKILATALEFSQRDGISRYYETTRYNCTTMAFDIIEHALNVRDPRLRLISRSEEIIPVLSPDKLKHYGGLLARPLRLDPSLASVSVAAFKSEIVVKRQGMVCSPDMENKKELCPNIVQAVNFLNKNKFLQSP